MSRWIKKKNKKIFVLSLHKSGTHLIQVVLEGMGFKSKFIGENASMKEFENLKNDEYLMSHYTPGLDVYSAIHTGNVKALFNFRDPRDVCVSRVEWWSTKNKKITNIEREFMKVIYSKYNKEQQLDLIIKGDVLIKQEISLPKMYREARGFLLHNNILNVRYESLVGEKGGGSEIKQRTLIKEIGEYLGIGYDVDYIIKDALNSKTETFNKGVIGRYKEIFSKKIILNLIKLTTIY